MDPGLHGSEWNPAGFGDFPVGHSRYLLQYQSFPLVLGQHPKRRFHLGSPAQLFRRVGDAGLLRCVAGRLRDFEQPPLPAGPADCVVRRANRDPAKPGANRPVPPVARRPPESAEKGLLGRIFGFGPVSKDGESHGAHPALGAADEFIEGLNVSLFPEPLKQTALPGVLQGSFRGKWINRRILWFLGRKTHRTRPFVRVGQECAAV